MKLILFICSLCLLTLLTTSIVDADIAKPKQSPAVKEASESRVVLHTSLQISPDSRIYDARLQIPESQLQEFRAALDAAQGNTTIAASVTRNSTRTMVAGVLLFLSLSFAGVWLGRSRTMTAGNGRTRKAVAAALIGMATIGAAALITRGNAGPPGYVRWKGLPEALSAGRTTYGSVDVEIVKDDKGIRLLLPVKPPAKQGEE